MIPLCVEKKTLRIHGQGIEGQDRRLLQPFSCQLDPGEMVALIGKNGSGKSTLLRHILGFNASSNMKIQLGKQDLKEYSSLTRAKTLAWLPQQITYSSDFTVKDFMQLGRFAHHQGFPQDEDFAVCEMILAELSLQNLGFRRLSQLSGGELQKVAIGRVLVSLCPFMILDEPLQNLDLDNAMQVLSLFRRMKEHGYTILYSLHGLELLFLHHERVWALSKTGQMLLFPNVESMDKESYREVLNIDMDVYARSWPFKG